MTLAARIAFLRDRRDHYAERELDYVRTTDDPRHPFAMLRRVTDRVLARLEPPQEVPCSTDPFSETPAASSTPRSAEDR